MPESHDEPLSIRDAAKLLKRSTKSLRNYVKAGRLPATKIPGPKGPQFVFRRADLVLLGDALQADVSGPVLEEAHGTHASGGTQRHLPAQLPSSVPALVDAFLTVERERTELLSKLAASQAESSHTIGMLEERVAQLQTRLKREERVAELSRQLEKELGQLKKRASERELTVARLRAAGRAHWWQFWRAPLPTVSPTHE